MVILTHYNDVTARVLEIIKVRLPRIYFVIVRHYDVIVRRRFRLIQRNNNRWSVTTTNNTRDTTRFIYFHTNYPFTRALYARICVRIDESDSWQGKKTIERMIVEQRNVKILYRVERLGSRITPKPNVNTYYVLSTLLVRKHLGREGWKFFF